MALTQPTRDGPTVTFSITIPANSISANMSAQIVFMAGNQEVAMLGVTLAMQVSFSQPSPTGYRLPTKAEYDTLLSNTNKAWPKNGTKLYLKLTDKVTPSNTLEFPAAGCRNGGTLVYEGTDGRYWSSTEFNSTGAGNLYFRNENAFTNFNDDKAYEYSVRCLHE